MSTPDVDMLFFFFKLELRHKRMYANLLTHAGYYSISALHTDCPFRSPSRRRIASAIGRRAWRGVWG